MNFIMIIDGNPKELEAMAAFLSGDSAEGSRIQDEFVSEFIEFVKTNDHCPCKMACKFHGKCFECVTIHRGHKHHLPECFREMVNDKLIKLSELTEHTMPVVKMPYLPK